MRNSHKLTALLKMRVLPSLLLLSALVLLPREAVCGRESGGGGGNGFVAEFRRLGEQAGQAFFEHQSIDLSGRSFDHRVFRSAIKAVALEPTRRKLVLKGQRVSAINYPALNKVIFNVADWAKLDRDAKMQLVIHELLGLRYRGEFDDGSYEHSRVLLDLTRQFTFESVALAAARAGNAFDYKMKLIPERTKILSEMPDSDGLGHERITEVAVRTFEHSSAKAARIYHVHSHDMLGVRKVELVRLEGGAGP